MQPNVVYAGVVWEERSTIGAMRRAGYRAVAAVLTFVALACCVRGSQPQSQMERGATAAAEASIGSSGPPLLGGYVTTFWGAPRGSGFLEGTKLSDHDARLQGYAGTKLSQDYIGNFCSLMKGRLACGDHFEDVAFPWAIHQKDAEGHTRVNYPNLKKNLRDCVPLRLMETVQKACGYHVPRDTYHTEYYKGVGESSSESSNWTDR